MTFTNTIKKILASAQRPMTPQEIREVIKKEYSHYYGTPSHVKNVKNGNYKDLDHAVLAQIYSLVGSNNSFACDRTSKPITITLIDPEQSGSKKHSDSTFSENISIYNRKNRRAKKHLALDTPTSVLVTRYLNKWDDLENYKLQESSLNLLFQVLCPENKRIEHVLLKVSALNDFYSTNIYNTYLVAKHILQKNIDPRLESSDYSLVNEIALISINEKKKNFYSFASKYCSHHKPNTYPIYDSFVEKMLLHYKEQHGFDVFTNNDLKNYEHFVEIIKKFRCFYKLDEFSLKQIDIFLWLAGKKYFPKFYNKQK